MRFLTAFAFIIAVLFSGVPVSAGDAADKGAQSVQAFLDSMTFEKGRVNLPNGIATLDIPDTFRYIGPEDSKRFLEKGWGNPNGSDQIGMLLPMGVDLFGAEGWAVVIRYQEDGYVSDKDAAKIDYDKMLKSLQAATVENNKEREATGYPPVTLVGWAAAPYYDSASKKLYWAKELKFGEDKEHTLNYNVRILGRKGVLVMNAVSGVAQLPMVRERMEQVIAFADFNPGHRYNDFDPGVDKVAAYGLAALIGGKLAVKAGLLAKLGGLLVAFKKFIIIGFMGLMGVLSKLFKGRKKEAAV
ncbi:MAG: DUF2167 domain-containing protein [Desulfobacteraceae bacterium]